MLVMRKINNNIALCQDGKGRILVALGKGIGFPKMPYELTDMNLVQSTYYNISPQYLDMLDSIPANVLEFTATVVDNARKTLPYSLSPNLLLTLADHISFALVRKQQGIKVPMPLTYDLEINYPTEMKIAKQTLTRIWVTFHTRLPENEASGICMGLVNARIYDAPDGSCRDADNDRLIVNDVTRIVEDAMEISIDRRAFNYARFATHVRYMLQRLRGEGCLETINEGLYQSVHASHADTADCVDKISDYLRDRWNYVLNDEERLYLMLHINRICNNQEP